MLLQIIIGGLLLPVIGQDARYREIDSFAINQKSVCGLPERGTSTLFFRACLCSIQRDAGWDIFDPNVSFIQKGKLYVCSSPDARRQFQVHSLEHVIKAEHNWYQTFE